MAIGGYRDEYPHAEDYDLYIRISEFGSIDNLDEDMLFYRRHTGAVSVKHVEVQERSAAMAELDAALRAHQERWPQWLADPYIRLRIWRRLHRIDPSRAKAMQSRILRDLFDLRPCTLFSRRYGNLRIRILAAFLRSLRASNVPDRNLNSK